VVDSHASVHLRLRGRLGDDDVTALRQRLAACLSSGVSDIRVHLEDQPDVDLAILNVLKGAGDYLRSLGGSLVVVGAQPRVLSTIRMNGLDRLLPALDPYPLSAPHPKAVQRTRGGVV